MRSWSSVVALVGVFACGPGGRSPDLADAPLADAPPEGLPPPRNDPGPGPDVQPFEATFVTPGGTFESKYLYAYAIGGDCDPPSWELRFTDRMEPSTEVVVVQIRMPRYLGIEVTGSMAAFASHTKSEPPASYTAETAAFEATRIDYPSDGAPRITGRLVVNDPAWAVDFQLDVLGLGGARI